MGRRVALRRWEMELQKGSTMLGFGRQRCTMVERLGEVGAWRRRLVIWVSMLEGFSLGSFIMRVFLIDHLVGTRSRNDGLFQGIWLGSHSIEIGKVIYGVLNLEINVLTIYWPCSYSNCRRLFGIDSLHWRELHRSLSLPLFSMSMAIAQLKNVKFYFDVEPFCLDRSLVCWHFSRTFEECFFMRDYRSRWECGWEIESIVVSS